MVCLFVSDNEYDIIVIKRRQPRFFLANYYHSQLNLKQNQYTRLHTRASIRRLTGIGIPIINSQVYNGNSYTDKTVSS